MVNHEINIKVIEKIQILIQLNCERRVFQVLVFTITCFAKYCVSCRFMMILFTPEVILVLLFFQRSVIYKLFSNTGRETSVLIWINIQATEYSFLI